MSVALSHEKLTCDAPKKKKVSFVHVGWAALTKHCHYSLCPSLFLQLRIVAHLAPHLPRPLVPAAVAAGR
jgi:hypothetical protein